MKWKYCWLTGIIVAVLLELFHLVATFYISNQLSKVAESSNMLPMFSFPPSLPEILGVITIGFIFGFIIGAVINLAIFIISKNRQNQIS